MMIDYVELLLHSDLDTILFLVRLTVGIAKSFWAHVYAYQFLQTKFVIRLPHAETMAGSGPSTP